jgi:hypothetical protein
MTTATMNTLNASMTGARNASRAPSLAFAKFLQQRAALPEMPEQESHASAVTGVVLRLAAAAVPAAALAWLALAG